jgi:DNA-directed RNA polymerase subunit RPC12/RpoP
MEDRGHIILECANCGAKLVNIWQTRSDEPEKKTARAVCCYCGDSSYPQSLNAGRFHYIGIASDPEMNHFLTQIDKVETENDNVIFYTIKVKQ